MPKVSKVQWLEEVEDLAVDPYDIDDGWYGDDTSADGLALDELPAPEPLQTIGSILRATSTALDAKKTGG